MVVTSGQTSSPGIKYVGRIPGGAGIIGIYPPSPDLLATYQINDRITGTIDLNAIIVALHSGSQNLQAMWRVGQSGSQNLLATVSGFYVNFLPAVIRPMYSGSGDISGFIEPIPPVDLLGLIEGFVFDSLQAIVSPIPAVELSATLSGQEYLDLVASVSGYYYEDLGASISGYFFTGLGGIITHLTPASGDLHGLIQPVQGIAVPNDIYGYFRIGQASSGDLSAVVSGYYFRDLFATVSATQSGNLSATISGLFPEGTLFAEIESRGGFDEVSGYVKSLSEETEQIPALIEGINVSDLSGIINPGPSEDLHGTVTGSGGSSNLSSFYGIRESLDLSAEYDSATADFLYGNIIGRGPADLYARVVPKVYFIDSSIPINLFAENRLSAMVNGDCESAGQFSDLSVIVTATNATELKASYIALRGQLAISVDELPIKIKQSVIDENWLFLIADQPAFTTNSIELIITNHPLKDLSASIEGVLPNSVLSGNITPIYLPSVKRDGTPIGEWVNPKTGERKLIKLFFRGKVNNFYYAQTAGTSFFENTDDFLEIIVESYQIDNQNRTSLLAVKQDVRRARVKNLNDFPTIDEAIKYAIAASLFELRGSLSATIFGIGGQAPLSGEIAAERQVSSLLGDLIPVANDPLLNAQIESSGGFSDLYAAVKPVNSQITATPFFDINGNRFMPMASVLESGDVSVILVPISVSGIVGVFSPDLQATISGFQNNDLSATISGL